MRSAPLALFLSFATLAWAAPGEAELRQKIVDTALGLKGLPYVYGAESAKAFDCSGFVHYVYRAAAELDLPRNSREQYAAGAPVAVAAAKPGDILVFDTVGGSPSHVAIFLGSGSMIHAASQGPRTGVIVSPLTDSYFGPRLLGARRFLGKVAAAEAPRAGQAAAAPGAAPAAAKPAAAPAPPGSQAPAPASAAASPPAAQAAAGRKPPIAQIGFTIEREPTVYTDKIPAATGTAIAFTVTNGTGKDGSFEIIFYKAEVDFSKTRILRREKVALAAGASREIEPYLFTEPGVYRLNVKSPGNDQLLQRVFKVVDAGR